MGFQQPALFTQVNTTRPSTVTLTRAIAQPDNIWKINWTGTSIWY